MKHALAYGLSIAAASLSAQVPCTLMGTGEDTTSYNHAVGVYSTVVCGDIDGDSEVEVLAYAFGGDQIRVFDGATMALELDILTGIPITLKHGNYWARGMALADFDRDGTSEIVITLDGNQMQAFNHDGTVFWPGPVLLSTLQEDRAGNVISVADVDLDGVPEVIVGVDVYDGLNGALLASPTVQGSSGIHPAEPLQGARFSDGMYWQMSVVVDILPDAYCTNCAGLEIVAGNTIYAVNISNGLVVQAATAYDENLSFSDGFTSVADVDVDGALDVVVQGKIDNDWALYIWDPLTGNLKSMFKHPAPYQTQDARSGRVNITNLDHDPNLEFVFVVSDLSNTSMLYAIDHHMGIRWQHPVRDLSGWGVSTTLNFCPNDEVATGVVFRSQDSLYIFDGFTGKLGWKTRCRSHTAIEGPIIADIDGDGSAEIVISGIADHLPAPPSSSQADGVLYTFGSAQNNWPSVREVWNQYGYYTTHVNDDLTIPTYPVQHHMRPALNRYLDQTESFAPNYANGHKIADIALAPNPVHDELMLTLNEAGQFTSWTVRDMAGRTVPVRVRSVGAHVRITCTDLTPGVYVLSGHSDTEQLQKTFVKQ